MEINLNFHSDMGYPPEQVDAAYATLLRILAHDEPEALQRTLMTMRAAPETVATGTEELAVEIGRSWLAAAGNAEIREPTGGPRQHVCSYPAHVVFEVAGPTTERGARRVAGSIIQRLLDTGTPLASVAGPLPGEPRLLNLALWIGSKSDGSTDAVEMEGYDE